MALLKVYKEIASLPATLQPDAIYLVRVGAGYDMYVTDTTGSIAYSSNGGGGAVDSVNGQTGVVVLGKADVGLANVDNTSDANKPVSTAQQTALNAKENTANKATTMTGNTASNVVFLTAKAVYDWAVALFQPLLVSGTNIKTINGSSVLGSGNLVVSGGDTTASEGALINSATSKATPVDADHIGLMDSAASNVLTKLSWANVKATLKTYFDTLYQAVLVSGTSIKTINGASVLGPGNLTVTGSTWYTGSGAPLSTIGNTNDFYLNASNGDVYTKSGALWNITSNIKGPTGSGSATAPPDVQIFTASGTWTKPAGAVRVEVLLIGAGGGGGSGRRGAANTNRYGGGSSSAGGVVIHSFLATQLANSVPVWIGAGGTGGAAVTTNDTNGNWGNAGGQSFFGGAGTPTGSYLATRVNGGGPGGTNAANGSGQAAQAILNGLIDTGNNLSSSQGLANQLTPGTSISSFGYVQSGGAGGGFTSANQVGAGGSTTIGGFALGNPVYNVLNGGAANGGAGLDGIVFTGGHHIIMTQGGSGGGAGNAAGTVAGGNGGNGAIGSSGGGGGASTNGANSGKGGDGGNGYCRIVTYFS